MGHCIISGNSGGAGSVAGLVKITNQFGVVDPVEHLFLSRTKFTLCGTRGFSFSYGFPFYLNFHHLGFCQCSLQRACRDKTGAKKWERRISVFLCKALSKRVTKF